MPGAESGGASVARERTTTMAIGVHVFGEVQGPDDVAAALLTAFCEVTQASGMDPIATLERVAAEMRAAHAGMRDPIVTPEPAIRFPSPGGVS